MIDDFGVILAKRTFKGCSKEHRMIKLNEYISLSKGKTISGRFSIDWTKSFEGIKKPQLKQFCLDCKNQLKCGECVVKRKLDCCNCKLERACKSWLNLKRQKKTYSTYINILKWKPANEFYQMLCYYKGEYEPKQTNIDFESAGKLLMKEDDQLAVKRRFERIRKMMEIISYTNYEEIPEKKTRYLFLDSNKLKQIKSITISYSVVRRMKWKKNNKLFNFWSIKFIIKEIQKRDFKITLSSFMTLVNKNIFFSEFKVYVIKNIHTNLNKCLCTVYNMSFYLKKFHWHTKFEVSLGKPFLKNIPLNSIFQDIFNGTKNVTITKKVSLTCCVSRLVPGFWWYYFSTNVSENITYE